MLFVPTSDNTALTAVTAVYEEWLCKHGPPSIIQSDRGTHFAAEVFKEMCALAGIRHKMGAPGHAHSQGQVERQNQLNMQVRCLAQNKVDLWPHAMLRVAFAHNTSVNETTGVSPYEVVYGRDPRTVEKVLLKESETQKKGLIGKAEMKQHVDELSKVKLAITKEIKEKTIQAQKKRSDEAFRKGEKYSLGDEVRIRLSTAERGKLGGKKMAPLYSDAYVVTEVLGQGWTYILEPLNGMGSKKMRHYNELKEIRRCTSTEEECTSPNIVLDVHTENKDTVNPVKKTKQPGNKRTVESIETNGHLRRSTREKRPVLRLNMTETSGKRYREEPVPLAEDTTSSEEEQADE